MTAVGAWAPLGAGAGGPAVSLVGAGPGDGDLLTLRAEALLAAAAVVVVDASVAGLAVAFAPGGRIVTVPDREPAVGALLAAVRADDRPVVRLYSGDTWLHPGHGPESAALTAAAVRFEAVAGVATEVALPAVGAGVAVHERHLAVVCTMTADVAHAPPATDPTRTLVVIADDLAAAVRTMAASGDPALPAAAVESTGRTTRALLGGLAAVAPHRPGVVVTGAVVARREAALR